MESSENRGHFETAGIWSKVREHLKAEIGEQKFRIWVDGLTLMNADSEKVEIGCPTLFTRDRVNQDFGPHITNAFKRFGPALGQVFFTVLPRPPHLVASNDLDARAAQAPESAAPAVAQPSAGIEGLAPGSIQLNPYWTFKDFVVGPSNQVAYSAALRTAELLAEGKSPAFNPLFFYGGSGLGKTHLLHAIAWYVLEHNPKARILFITAETFMRRFVSAMRERDTFGFKDELGAVDILLVDDIQFIARTNLTQDEFFYRFNALIDQNKQIVFSADRSPALLDGVAERVKTRMQHGITLEIHPTDSEMRLAIIQRKLERYRLQYPGLVFPEEVQTFLAMRVSTNTRELEGALTRIVYSAETLNEPVSMELVQREVSDVLRACDRRLTVDEIKRTVANFFGLKLADLDSPSRVRNLVRPRQAAMYLAKTMTSRSYPDIGRRFGKRDHTTVMHAVKKIEELMRSDSNISDDIDTLKRMLREGQTERPNKPGT